MLVNKYNQEQYEAITFPAKPLLIVAGAGTGKTTTIIGRIAYLIKNEHAVPSSILALTFTIDAASNLKNKLVYEIGCRGSEIHACTFHAFAQSQSIQYYKELGYSKSPVVMNQGDVYYLIQKNFDKLNTFKSEVFRRAPMQAIQAFKRVFEAFRHNLLSDVELQRLKNNELDNLKTIEDQSRKEQIYQLIDIVEAYPHFQRWKMQQNCIDYGDMILNLWTLINTHEKVLSKLQKKYQHIIVDEFQDNNYALSQIIEKIAEPENSITVVGDDDQCIYAFRQANIQNIQQFKKRYYTNNHTPITLLKNYRSTQSILDVANSVIQQNEGRVDKSKLLSDKLNNLKPVLYIGSEYGQMNKVAELIQELLQSGEYPGNIAILLRSHSKCNQISKYLECHGIYTYYHSEKLFEQSIIKDLISFLNLWAETDQSDHSMLRILRKLKGASAMNDLSNNYYLDNNSGSIIEYLSLQNNSLAKYALEIVADIRSIKNNNIENAVWELCKIGKFYAGKDKNSLEERSTHQALNQFREMVSLYCHTYSDMNSTEFVNFVNIQKQINDEPLQIINDIMDIPAVRVMTIHNAKGMEFKHVFIPFLRSGTFPHRYQNMKIVDRLPVSWQRWNAESRDESDLHYEEERRLFYVAITRARNSLVLFAPPKYQSQFIKQINQSEIRLEEIMETEESLSIYEKLIGKYQTKLQLEIGLHNFIKAKEILYTINNIVQLSKGDDPDWLNEEIKKEVLSQLSTENINTQVTSMDLSASSINIYNNCPLHYKYKYIDHIKGAPERLYFELGKIVHKVLEIFHKNNMNTFKELISVLDEKWYLTSYKYLQEKEQSREDAELMLKNYWKYLKNNPVRNIITEHWFSFETQFGTLNGKCDRVELKNNQISIMDYKTSKKPKTTKDLKNNIQLGIYAMFLFNKGITIGEHTIKGLPEKMSMLYLREENPEVSIIFEESDIKRFSDQINNVSDNITQGNFEPSKGKHCDWCDYRDLLCPIYG